MTIRLARYTPAFVAGLLMTIGLACSSAKGNGDDPPAPFGGPDSGQGNTGRDAAVGRRAPPTPGTDDASDTPEPEPGDASDAASSTDAAGDSSGPVVLAKSWPFDTAAIEPWSVDYAEPASLKDPRNTPLVWDATEGIPTKGAMKATIPFTAANQKVDIAINLEAPTDLTGKTLTARFKLVSGLSTSPASPGGVKLFVKSGNAFMYADGDWNNVDTNDWMELTLNASKPKGYVAKSDAGVYSAAEIRQIGIEVGTSSTGGGTPAVVLIDTVGWY